ncbi:SOS response-associated peptidase [Pontiella sp.]|uniref:SOS response-associated peptidase n=1 Tax=Pontiella sp. TaxID=2837462 RepID=UPI003566AA67
MADIELPPLFHRRYNIAPTQRIAVIRQQTPPRAEECLWGFEPPRAGSMVINARSETLAERPMFKDLLSANRCLIPADGFYEWNGKQSYYFQLPDRQLFAFAGLWRENRCVIVTRAADQNMHGIHDRMPVIILSPQWQSWLDTSRPAAFALAGAGAPPPLTARPVSRRVNRVANDGPECLEPGEVQTGLALFPEGE